MKRPRLHRADWALVAILVPLAVAAAVIGQSAVRDTSDAADSWFRTPSSFSAERHGARAIYLIWAELGYDVGRLQRTLTASTLAEADALVILAPWQPPTLEEEAAVLAWVRQGGRLLIAPDAMSGWGDDWFRPPTRDLRDLDLPEPPANEGDAPVADTDRSNNSADDADEPFRPTFTAGEDRVFTRRHRRGHELAEQSPLTVGVDAIEVRDYAPRRFDLDRPLRGPLADEPFEIFWQDDAGALGLDISYGDGRIIAVGDSFPLTNIALIDADNDLFTANIAAALTGSPGSGRVLFNEYHHGYVDRDISAVAIVRLIVDDGREWAAIQALLVAALAVFAAAIRFGRPRDLNRRTRPTQRQFIRAGARLLEDYRSQQRVGEILYTHHRRQLCRLVHQPANVDDTLLARAVADRSGVNITAALRSLNARQSPPTGHELLDAARTLHSAVEALTYGAR